MTARVLRSPGLFSVFCPFVHITNYSCFRFELNDNKSPKNVACAGDGEGNGTEDFRILNVATVNACINIVVANGYKSERAKICITYTDIILFQ